MSYIREFNQKFMTKAAQPGTAFVRVRGTDLDQVFSIQQERVVNRDSTVHWANCCPQMEKTPRIHRFGAKIKIALEN